MGYDGAESPADRGERELVLAPYRDVQGRVVVSVRRMDMTAERIAAAYLNQEAMKRECWDRGASISGDDNRYATSPYERLAHAADALERLMVIWEEENPAPDGQYWSCNAITGTPCLWRYGGDGKYAEEVRG